MIWDRKYVHFFGLALEALPEEKRRMGLLCLLAALGHVLAFFVLHIEYPATVPTHVTRTNISLFSPEIAVETSERDKEIWYELNDPSRLIRVRSNWLGNDALDVRLLQPSEVSRAQVILSEDRNPSFLPSQLAPLPLRAQASLRPPLQVFRYEISDQPAIATQTVAEWEEPLRSRWIGAAWNLPSVSSDLLNQSSVTVLRLAVDSRGEVEHVLVESGSIRSEIDLMGVEAAWHLRFLPVAAAPLQWGRVSIFWKLVTPQPEVVPNKLGGGP